VLRSLSAPLGYQSDLGVCGHLAENSERVQCQRYEDSGKLDTHSLMVRVQGAWDASPFSSQENLGKTLEPTNRDLMDRVRVYMAALRLGAITWG
jgi:hypothetical protein